MRMASQDRGLLRPLFVLIVGCVLTVALPGCGGCTWTEDPATAKKTAEEKEKEKEKAKKKKKSEKPVEDFTMGRILVQPSEVIKGKPDINYVKRGHWVAASQAMKANNFDVPQAELQSITADPSGVPFDIEHTDYRLLFSQNAPLPKGQTKSFEGLFFVPRQRVDTRPPALRNELVPQRGGLQMQIESTPVLAMDEWQYLFLVLSTRPSAYNILQQTQTFEPATDTYGTSDQQIRYYRLLRPSIDKQVPLPANSLAWTALAVILWDDIDPSRLKPNQQQALLDWLHWGGQLVVSGPNALDKLKGSFLDPYLPATNKASANLSQTAFDEINKHWSLRSKKRADVARELEIVKEITGVSLALTERGEYLQHTGELVAAGRVGQGRIVVTAFSLASGAVQKWPNFDGFLNGALLLRPGREFRQTKDEQNNPIGHMSTWADPYLNGDQLAANNVPASMLPNTNQLAGRDFRRDARLISNLRYFSRDMGFAPGDGQQHPYTDLRHTKIEPEFSFTGETAILSTALRPGPDDDERFGGYLAVPLAGVASWNDFSGTVNVAREHLNDAAGVKIPKADFVAKVLGVYLIVLVPLNWLFFRAIRRVEWAWIAAPLIAVIGAISVIRLAQLDIGFVRSRTEIDVVEIHAGYSRAHVSRFIALYTSLSTGYDLEFEDPSALAQPLAVSNQYSRKVMDAPDQVHFRQQSRLSLSGFKVPSNSTKLVHAEQMHDTGGLIELLGDDSSSWRIKNGSDLMLKDVGVVRRTTTGGYQVVYVPELQPGSTASITFRDLPPGDGVWVKEWDSTGMLARVSDDAAITGELRLGRFAELASQHLKLQGGDARLVAWSPQEIGGIKYSPDASQVNGVSFVLAHLRRGRLPEPQVDKNILQDVVLQQIGGDQPLPGDPASPE